MQKIKYILVFIFVLSLCKYSFSQKGFEFTDDSYKFKITFSEGWQKPKTEETDNKDVKSYNFSKKNDSSNTIMILAFKFQTIKKLDDFIYVLEKDASLNIPPKSGDFASMDAGNYEYKSVMYKDKNFTELIYYYVTKVEKAEENYAYMIRLISSKYNTKIENSFKDIVNSFKPQIQ
ncbi:hypothetical protein D4R20_03340 [bacterium]|nr:MAG: hypothetical protein D4R20_03340 [bacterium]